MSACVTTSSDDIDVMAYPPFPKAGEAVAEELSTLNPDEYPAFHDWLDRLDKLSQQLEQLP